MSFLSNLASKAKARASQVYDQLNMFDNGRTYQQRKPIQVDGNGNPRSVLSQATHNGVSNTLGNFVAKPIAGTVTGNIIEPGRSALAFFTGNDAAYKAAEARKYARLGETVPGFFAHNIVEGTDAGYNLAFKAPILDLQGKTVAADKARTHGLEAFNRTGPGQALQPVQRDIATTGALINNRPMDDAGLQSVGIDPKASFGKQVTDTAMGIASTYGLGKGVADPKGVINSATDHTMAQLSKGIDLTKSGISKAQNATAALQEFARQNKANEIGAIGKNVIGKNVKDTSTPAPLDPSVALRPDVKYAMANKDALLADYQQRFPTNILNTDNVREVFDKIGYDRKNSADFHEGASHLSDILFKQQVDNLQPGDKYLFMAGSSGAGKSVTLAAHPEIAANVAAGLDGNFSSKSALAKLDRVIKTGAEPTIAFVDRDPVAAWGEGVMKRALDPNNGRIVPADVFVDNYFNSRKITVEAARKYGDKIEVSVFKEGQPIDNPVDYLSQKGYNKSYVKQQVLESIATAKANGQIDSATAKRLAGGYSKELSAVERSIRQRSEQQNAPVNQPKVVQNSVTKGGKEGRQNISPEVQKDISGDHIRRNTKELNDRSTQAVEKLDLGAAIDQAHEKLAKAPGTMPEEDMIFAAKAMERADMEGRPNDATAIHDALSEHWVAKGQASQAASLLYQRSPQGILYKAMRDLGKAGVEVTPEMKKELQGLTNKIKEAKNPVEKMRNVAEFHQKVSKLMPQSVGDKLTSIWKAGLLSGVKTQTGNFTSNAVFAGLKAASDPASAFYDKLISLGTKERTKTATQRGGLSGFGEGVSKGVDTLKTGFDERNYDGGKYEQHAELNFKNPTMQKVFGVGPNMVFRGMNAADQPWYYAALKKNMYDLAKADGLNKGLRGAELRAHMEKMVADPTEKMASRAQRAADKATLNYDTIGSKAVQGIHRGIDNMKGDQHALGRQVAHGAVNVLAPFVRVPTAYLARSLDYTPVGAIKALVHSIYDEANGRHFDQRALSEALGEATTGTAVVFMGGALAGKGLISGQQPTDPKEVARWKAEHITPNSIKVGDKWISLNYAGPFGILLGMGRDYHDAAARGDDGKMAAIAGAGKNLSGQSFLTGFSGFSNAIQDPQRSAKSFVNSEAGSLVPSWMNDIANLGDGYQRETNTALDSIKSRVPVARNHLPKKQDVYGNDLRQRSSNGPEFLNRLNVLANPGRPSDAVQGNDVIDEVSRLHSVDVNNKDLQVTPTPVDKKFTVGGEQVSLNDTQRHDLQKLIGQATQRNWGTLIQTPEYKSLSDTDKAAALNDLRRNTAEIEQRKYVTENNLGVYKKDLSTAAANLASGNSDIASYARASSDDGSSSIRIAKNLSADSRKMLSKYNSLDKAGRTKLFNDDNAAEYNYEKAKFENDEANGELSKAQLARGRRDLARSKVGSSYTKEVRDLYGLTKAELYGVLSTDKNGKGLAEQIIAYGDAIEKAGLGDNKFRDSKGNVAIAPKATGSGSGGSKKSAKGKALDISQLASLSKKTAGFKVKGVSLNSKVSGRGLQAFRKPTAAKLTNTKKVIQQRRLA